MLKSIITTVICALPLMLTQCKSNKKATTQVQDIEEIAQHMEMRNKKGDFTAQGILGQFIFVSPSENLIIVRLGEKHGNVDWKGNFEKIKEVLKR